MADRTSPGEASDTIRRWVDIACELIVQAGGNPLETAEDQPVMFRLGDWRVTVEPTVNGLDLRVNLDWFHEPPPAPRSKYPQDLVLRPPQTDEAVRLQIEAWIGLVADS